MSQRPVPVWALHRYRVQFQFISLIPIQEKKKNLTSLNRFHWYGCTEIVVRIRVLLQTVIKPINIKNQKIKTEEKLFSYLISWLKKKKKKKIDITSITIRLLCRYKPHLFYNVYFTCRSGLTCLVTLQLWSETVPNLIPDSSCAESTTALFSSLSCSPTVRISCRVKSYCKWLKYKKQSIVITLISTGNIAVSPYSDTKSLNE